MGPRLLCRVIGPAVRRLPAVQEGPEDRHVREGPLPYGPHAHWVAIPVPSCECSGSPHRLTRSLCVAAQKHGTAHASLLSPSLQGWGPQSPLSQARAWRSSPGTWAPGLGLHWPLPCGLSPSWVMHVQGWPGLLPQGQPRPGGARPEQGRKADGGPQARGSLCSLSPISLTLAVSDSRAGCRKKRDAASESTPCPTR